ncbi:hypothetical protein BZL35_00469 [Candidatus Pandoraea novymonadis]|uniref:Lipopolysaccharide assembly protein A domain-containing protein n=1 Tax=Candidatus Pandoraea novymonadis TaxID=1808959 RepID=A0ABX5FEZ1_9BURK|nr:hypothetical protein BZL35_00469 [Candidatus Pandoraea novymonadis]
MKLIFWIVRLVIFVFLLGFSLVNTNEITLNLLVDYRLKVPFIIFGLIFFVVCCVIGVFAILPSLIRCRVDLRQNP